MGVKAKDSKKLKGNGHLNTPNVNAPSECTGFTYTVWGIKKLEDVPKLQKKLDRATKETESFVNVAIEHLGTSDQTLTMKWKIKHCGDQKAGKEISHKCDLVLQKMSGQTVLDMPTIDEDDADE